MRNPLFFHIKVFFPAVFLTFLVGCAATEPSRFYSLSSLDGTESAGTAKVMPDEFFLGVGPVKVPDYLDRPQIVTRTGNNELKIADFDRWAGSLQEDFSRVLAENLSFLLATDRVAIYPWKRFMPVRYQVAVNVIHFDGMAGDAVSLSAQWSILEADERKMLVTRRSTFSEKTTDKDYNAFVAAMSSALGAFSREIADEIKAVSRSEAGN